MRPRPPVVAVRRLRVERGGRTVLRDLDLEVRAGEVLALVGPNGSGKTTLIRAMAGLQPAAAGEVLLEGRPVRSLPAPVRARRLAVLLQHNPVAFDLTAAQVAALGGPDDLPPQRVARALARLGLAALADRPWSRLSGGERQRVHLARCLAAGTPVLLLDEPTNHLDLPGRALLAEALAERGRTVVLATHDLELASRADRIVLLDAGRLAAAGPIGEVLAPGPVGRVFRVPFRALPDPEGGPPALRVLPHAPPLAGSTGQESP